MALIRPLGDIVRKYRDVTPLRTPYYEAGVKAPLRNWEEQSLKAAANWAEGVAKAAADKRYERRVKEVGLKKWQDMAIAKGTGRWGPGIEIGLPYYENAFAKVREVIEKTELPPRYPKGDPRNIERVRVMAAALRKLKVG